MHWANYIYIHTYIVLSRLNEYWPRSFWPSPRWLSAPRCRGMFRNRKKHDLIHSNPSERWIFYWIEWFSDFPLKRIRFSDGFSVFWWNFIVFSKLYFTSKRLEDCESKKHANNWGCSTPLEFNAWNVNDMWCLSKQKCDCELPCRNR